MTLLATDHAVAPERPRRDEAIEPRRLERSLTLAFSEVGPRQYMVQGRDEPFYYVDLSLDVPCTCVDATLGGNLCKHALRSLTAERDPRVFDAVLALYERRVRLDREAQSAASPRRRRPARRARPTADEVRDSVATETA